MIVGALVLFIAPCRAVSAEDTPAAKLNELAGNVKNLPYADEEPLEKALGQLLDNVRKSLPSGWHARIVPSKQDRSDVPALLVSRDASVLGWYETPNRPPDKPVFKASAIEFHFPTMPYLTPEEHRAIAERNHNRQQKRGEFAKQLSNIKWGWMGGRPFPPSAYSPMNGAEEELVREYAFLWQSTMPEALPDLYFQTLSFKSDVAQEFRCENAKDQDELDKVRQTVVALFQKYMP